MGPCGDCISSPALVFANSLLNCPPDSVTLQIKGLESPVGIMKRIFIFCVLAIAMVCPAVAADDHSKLTDLIARAEHGDAAAQLSLAVTYRDGKGADKDYPLAMHWAHLAADQGDAKAMDFIGYAYLTGRGAEQSECRLWLFPRRRRFFRAGGIQPGAVLFRAQGADQDIPKAMAAWKKAAEMGEGRAASNAAMVYLSGEGIPADPKEALRLATRSPTT